MSTKESLIRQWNNFIIWMNTPPNPNDAFFVNIRELWQAYCKSRKG